MNGPFAAITTYLSEFHCARHRARVQMVLGIIFSCGTVILPLLAWAILPLDLDVKAFNATVGNLFILHKLTKCLYFYSIVLEFHSWNLFLLIIAMPALAGSIAFMFMPESPKFLMTTGRNKKALEVFQTVYSFNTGKPPETFPVSQHCCYV